MPEITERLLQIRKNKGEFLGERNLRCAWGDRSSLEGQVGLEGYYVCTESKLIAIRKNIKKG